MLHNNNTISFASVQNAKQKKLAVKKHNDRFPE